MPSEIYGEIQAIGMAPRYNSTEVSCLPSPAAGCVPVLAQIRMESTTQGRPGAAQVALYSAMENELTPRRPTQ